MNDCPNCGAPELGEFADVITYECGTESIDNEPSTVCGLRSDLRNMEQRAEQAERERDEALEDLAEAHEALEDRR